MIYPIFSISEGSNCYLIKDKKVALIDSGINPEVVIEKINKLNIGIDFIINTHCHYDHVAGNLEIKRKTNAKILAHEIDAEAMERGDDKYILAYLFSDKSIRIDVDIKLYDKDKVSLGSSELEVIHTPGHTRGSICLYEEKSRSLFSGDVIFAFGIGRTDFPGGNSEELKKSIEKLIEFHNKYGIDKIYPGHGPLFSGDEIERVYELYF